MTLEVLLATMGQCDDTVLDQMAIASDVLVCNQNNQKTEYRTYEKNGCKVRWYDFCEKGVGLNRNNALLRATGDICILADDDITYCPGYQEIILNAFRENPEADLILFNIESLPGEHRYTAKKKHSVWLHNCGKYGAVRIAFRRMSVIKNAVCFNQLFGGGSMFTAGEDTMFIRDSLRKGLKVIAVPQCILKLNDLRPSTWFTGYDQKYFEDMGSSYYYHFRRLAIPCLVLQLLKRRKTLLQDVGFSQALQYVVKGVNKYKNLR
jgi:glycosyltransferase involved in cell wall biosynthesis